MKQEQVKEHFAIQADEYEELMVKLVPEYLEQNQIICSLLPNEDKNYIYNNIYMNNIECVDPSIGDNLEH